LGINVLSVFDGMSCGQIALNRANINYDNYYASEIKKNAIKVTNKNYPNTIQLGNILDWENWNLPNIDLFIGGSPCQDFTRLKVGEDNKGYFGEKSKLFFVYVEILKYLKLKNHDILFLLENVYMKEEFKNNISEILGVQPIRINSNLVSFQNRDRLYWTNIQSIEMPEDKHIGFQENKSLDYNYLKKYKVNKTPSRIKMYEKQCPNVTYREKINALLCKQDRRNNSGLVDFEDFCRYLTTEELEKAQTVPLGYTSCVSKNQAEDLLGDGWTVDVIAHIFSYLPEEFKRSAL
jgi:DNA (cytosine-5)-methyltransferase 3A